MKMNEPLPDLFCSSKLMILDFADIPADTMPAENIRQFFETCERGRADPRSPECRQEFNNRLLAHSGARYLVSRYGEDRRAMLAGSKIAGEGRTLHMGIDIFCRELETVFAPCDGTIVRTGREPGGHSYGYYLIFKPQHLKNVYFFFGHLSKRLPAVGSVKAAEPIARLGDFAHGENGGWSRHLHIQAIARLPKAGSTPDGYSAPDNFASASRDCPNPLPYFPEWKINT